MKQFHLWSAILGIALLIVLILDVGPGKLLGDFTLLGWTLLPFIAVEVVADGIHTLAWRYCLSGSHRRLPFTALFRIRMSGYAIGYLTPTASLGGEVIRGSLLSVNESGAHAAGAVLIDKLTYSLSQVLFVVAGSLALLVFVDLPSGLGPALIAGSLLLVCGIFGFLYLQKKGKLGAVFRRPLVLRIGGRRMEALARHLTAVDEELASFYRHRSGDFFRSLGWHVVGFACGIVQSWIFLLVMMQESSIALAAGVWFLGSWFDLLAFAIPMNIGVLEGARMLSFRLLGLPHSLGLTYGVALRMEQLARAFMGLAFYAVGSLSLQRTKPTVAVDKEGGSAGDPS